MSERITTYTNDGLTFDVSDEGPSDGVPVVLLHGFPERNTSWRSVAPLLHEHGLRTFAPDQRGYSPGARPTGRDAYRVSHLTRDVLALIERIGQPVHLVGHDWGAAVGWVTALRSPDLVLSWTAISVPHPAAFYRAARTSRQGLKSWYMAFFQLPRVPEWLASRPRGPFDGWLRRSGMSRDDVARFHTEIVEYGAFSGGLNWYRALPLSRPGDTAGKVRVPTTMVWSDGDVAIDRTGVDATAGLVDAPYDLVVLEGVSHWIPTQAPDACAAAIVARTGVA